MTKSKTKPKSKSPALPEEEVGARAQFQIDQVLMERTRTTFILTMSKEGYNQIIFDLNERADLKGLLLNIFESGKAFDFQISEKLPKGQCRITSVRRAWSGVMDDGEPEGSSAEEADSLSSYKNYRVLLRSQRAYKAINYFRIEKPAQAGKIAWVRAPRTSQMDSLMNQAFNRGLPIRVWVGNPVSYPAFDNDLVARVFQCEIEFAVS
jgi:hypothetical protein